MSQPMRAARKINIDTAERQMLTRMATSRTELLAAQAATRSVRQARGRSLVSHVREVVATAPNVTLLMVIVASAAVIGPRRVASLVVRNGLTAWIGTSVRRLAGR